jgi:hypothetical protein
VDSKIQDLITAQIEKSREKLDAAKTLLREGFIDDVGDSGGGLLWYKELNVGSCGIIFLIASVDNVFGSGYRS